MYKDTCILYTSQCFLNCCWANKGSFGQGKARDWPRLLGPRLLGPRLLGPRHLGPRLLGPSLLGTLMYKVAFSFHHMAVINFTDLISSGVRAQQGQAWRRRCCVVFDQEFQPVLSLVSHLFSPAKKCCKPWEMVEKRRDFYQSITCSFNSSGTNFFDQLAFLHSGCVSIQPSADRIPCFPGELGHQGIMQVVLVS